jgi:hypothetical protein
MLLELSTKISGEPCILFLVRYNYRWQLLEDFMAHDKRYVAQKRQRRRRKAAKTRVKEFEQGKVAFDKLPKLAKALHHRKVKAAKRNA